MALNPWSHDNPFTPGTLIRADEMNAALQGIAASLDEFATDLTNFVVRLPDNFTGENQIPDQTFTERLLYIDAAGSMSFYSLSEFNAGIQQVADDKLTVQNYKNTASTKAGEASSSASAAAGYASTASNHANTANQYRVEAQKWANEAEDVQITTGNYSAYHWAMKAANAVAGISYNWSTIVGKPNTFPPSAHTHPWSQIENPPSQATRWPNWGEVGSKPATFPPSSHGHSMGEISGLNAALDAQSTSSVYNNSNQTVTRLGKVTEVCSASTGNVTKTLDMSTFSVGDIVRIHKTQQQGDLTIATDAGAIQIPNATQAMSHVVRDGDIAVVNLFKITSTLWALSLY